MMHILLVLGENIYKYRKELGWTQAELAEKAGISVPFMTQIENGKKSASLEVIQNIAEALQIPYKNLFDEKPSTKLQNLLELQQNLSKLVLNDIQKEFSKFLV